MFAWMGTQDGHNCRVERGGPHQGSMHTNVLAGEIPFTNKS